MIRELVTLRRNQELIRFVAAQRRSGGFFKMAIGRGWLVISPLAEMLIYYFLVAVVFQSAGAGGIHPFVMIMTGIVHYAFLQQALGAASSAILGNEQLLMQIAIEPITFVAVTFYQRLHDFLIVLALFACFYLLLGPGPSARWALYPVCLLLLLLIAWSWSIIVASLTVFVRDLERLTSIVLRMLMYMCPVVYLLEFVPAARGGLPVRDLYLYNPLACLFALFQASLLGGPVPPPGPLAVLVAFVAVSAVASIAVYRRARPRFTKAF